MEAAASGLSAIVSRQGGVTESIEHGVNGFCVNIDDEIQWLESLDALVCNDTLRLGIKGRVKMEQRSIRASCQQFLQQHRF